MSGRTVQGVRSLQAALLVGALLAGLAWAESAPAATPRGSDALSGELSAPVVKGRGPWTNGTVLTLQDAGIPIDIAPMWTMTARYSAAGLASGPASWRAEAVFAKIGDDGRAWWRVTEPVAVRPSDNAGTATFDAAALVQRAAAYDGAAGSPGRLQIQVRLVRTSNVTVDDDAFPSTRAVALTIAPSGTFAVVEMSRDQGGYGQRVDRSFNVLPLVLLASAGAGELWLVRMRRQRPAWQHARGVTTLQVRGLQVPERVAEATIEGLFDAARRTGALVLVDPEQRLMLLAGDPALIASLSEGAPSEPSPPPGQTPSPSSPPSPQTLRAPAKKAPIRFSPTGHGSQAKRPS